VSFVPQHYNGVGIAVRESTTPFDMSGKPVILRGQ